jgi:molybdopterin synthase catalytic subunit
MFELSDQPINPGALRDSLAGRQSGALATFEGWVRDHNDGKAVSALEYEAYPELAAREGERIVQEAMAKFKVHSARCMHRLGALAISDIAVWVGATAAHRGDAFAACQFIIDEVKARVPIWKREQYADGHVEWVNCSNSTTESGATQSSATEGGAHGTAGGGELKTPVVSGRRHHEHAH